MEHIFSTDIVVDNKSVVYNIDFENEKYTFRPREEHTALPSFELSLQNNEWIEQEAINPAIKKQAVASLETYLLSQH